MRDMDYKPWPTWQPMAHWFLDTLSSNGIDPWEITDATGFTPQELQEFLDHQDQDPAVAQAHRLRFLESLVHRLANQPSLDVDLVRQVLLHADTGDTPEDFVLGLLDEDEEIRWPTEPCVCEDEELGYLVDPVFDEATGVWVCSCGRVHS